MTRPNSLDLTSGDFPWRQVPMPGANLGLDIVPLPSPADRLSILGRFPVGFVRDTPGGYLHGEEFFVLSGFLEIHGVRYRPGTLTYIPAGFLRNDMAAPEGCSVLAWFAGPATFRAPEELPATDEAIRSVDLRTSEPGLVLATPHSKWSLASYEDWPEGAEGFDLAGTGWACSVDDWIAAPPGPMILRQPSSTPD